MSSYARSGIMEVTLRDGSYAINFGFTAHDTALIAKAMEGAGFGLIEIGHGVGLNASNRGYGKAAATDEEYLEAAARSLKSARFGMFCIPGIARLEDIDMAAAYNMNFIRIGVNPAEIDKAVSFIARAKKHGMMVCCNFMKSYAVSAKEFVRKAVQGQRHGADYIYLVDSAGGMVPSEVLEYVRSAIGAGVKNLAFHGHNNLGLAESNSLQALLAGASLIDVSLQGIGRSSGNTVAERMLAIMNKSGLTHGVDIFKAMDIGERYIRPLMRRRGLSSLDVVCGASLFHSSYMHIIRKYSVKYQVDPRLLIKKVCEIDKVNCDEDVVRKAAESLPVMEKDGINAAEFNFNDYFGHEQDKLKR